jgi:hypothetical protein
MRIKIQRKWDSKHLREAMRDFLFDFCGEKQGYLIFEGCFGFGIPNSQLNIGVRELREFTKELIVEGGTKNVKGRWLFVRPYQNKGVYVRIPQEHYELLKEYAKEMRTKPISAIQDAIGEKLFLWMQRKKSKSKKEEREYA